MDKRRHPRLHLQLPIRFIVEQPETRDSQAGQGMLKNISYGGILFQVEPPLPVKPGNIREFSFFLTPENSQAVRPDASPGPGGGPAHRTPGPEFFSLRGGGPVSLGVNQAGCEPLQ